MGKGVGLDSHKAVGPSCPGDVPTDRDKSHGEAEFRKKTPQASGITVHSKVTPPKAALNWSFTKYKPGMNLQDHDLLHPQVVRSDI